MSIEEQSSGTGPTVTAKANSTGAGNLQANDQAMSIAGSAHTSFPDDYIQRQIRDGWPDLSDQERAWADEYVINGYNHREAAEEIGINASKGIGFTRKPLIRRYISYVEGQISVSLSVSKIMLDSQYATIQDIAMGEVDIPIVTGDGTQLYRKKFNGDLAVKCLQERAKLAGISKEDEGKGGVVVNIDVGALLGHGNTETVIEGETVDE